MIKKRTVCVVSSSRADYNHLYILISKLNKSKNFNLKIIVTGMHMIKDYGYTYKEIINDGFKINKKIQINQQQNNEESILESISFQLKQCYRSLTNIRPDIVILLGDRYDIYPIAIACHVMKIPLAHLHGGEVTHGVIDDAFRHSISKMADIHFTSHKDFKNRLVQMGENPKNIYNIGSLGVDAIKQMKFKSKNYICKKYNLNYKKKYFLVCIHPETLISDNKSLIECALQALNAFDNYNLIFTYPNSDPGSSVILKHIKEYIDNNSKCTLIKSFGRKDFLNIMKYSSGLIGNSSSGIVEAPALATPTINIGTRQTGRPIGKSIYNANSATKSIIKAIDSAIKHNVKNKKIKSIYEGKNSIDNILKILSSLNLANIKNKKFRDIKHAE